VAGTLIADTPRAARDQLRQRGLTVTEVRPHGGDRPGRPGVGRRRRYPNEVVALVRELATLTKAGIVLLTGSPKLRRALLPGALLILVAGIGVAFLL
jgi:type II secretory pathway component PulF